VTMTVILATIVHRRRDERVFVSRIASVRFAPAEALWVRWSLTFTLLCHH